MFFKKTTRGKSLYFNKKDFTFLGQRDFIKKLSNDNYVYIVYQRVFIPLGSNPSANVCNPGC